MARYFLIALNGPTEGNEDAYNEWYKDVHAADLLSIDGAVSVRRFAIEKQNRVDMPYVSVTEFEAEDSDELLRQLGEKASDFPDSIDRSRSIFVLGREISRIDKAG